MNIITLINRFIKNPKQNRIFEFIRTKIRTKILLHKYKIHYKKSQKSYLSENNIVTKDINSVYDIGVQNIFLNKVNNLVNIPNNYLDIVDRICKDVNVRFEKSKNCLPFPKIESSPMPELTKDIPSIEEREVLLLLLTNYMNIDGLEELCSLIVPQLEQNVFHSFINVGQVQVFRSLVSEKSAFGSRLWHYDQQPREFLKLMIYLTDVDEDSGPFEYLRFKNSHKAVLGTFNPFLADSRLSERRIDSYLQKGVEPHKVLGSKGATFLFDNNIIHRGNIPTSNYRDAITLTLKPVTFRIRPHIDVRWTGSFQHFEFNNDPEDFAPKLTS